MKKYIILCLSLIVLNICLFSYLKIIINNKEIFLFKYEDNPILVHNNNIILNSTDEFNFNNYFNILTFNTENYSYEFNNNYLIVEINNNLFKFKYDINEPEIIEKVVYIDRYIDKSKEENTIIDYQIDTNINTNIENIGNNVDYFYIDNNYFEFSLDTDISIIADKLTNNLHTSYVTKLDYSNLNVSQIGQYIVYYVSDKEKIEVTIKIV